MKKIFQKFFDNAYNDLRSRMKYETEYSGIVVFTMKKEDAEFFSLTK